MDDPIGFVELDRRFRRLESGKTEEDSIRSYLSGPVRTEYDFDWDWDKVLDNRLVVILAESGSGKSWEMRHRSSVIPSEKGFGFFVPLERLVSDELLDVFSPSQKTGFAEWQKAREKPAWFFLDSADEAKFRKTADFYTALDRFVEAIEQRYVRRANVVISSRLLWRPETDAHEVALRFRPFLSVDQDPAHSAPAIPPTFVSLQPLDRDRVIRFVEAKGLSNAADFVSALDDCFGWEFARRPLDVLDLIEFWKRHGRLGSLKEMVKNDVVVKLSETEEKSGSDPLSIASAQEGAMALAAATVFCKQLTFRVPDDSSIDSQAIDASRCLPATWQPAQISALLNRALFDNDSYGRIRFYHRSVGEFLAAEWLSSRMANGCPKTVLDRLLFASKNGARVLRRTLAPIVAWLCATDESWGKHVRTWVLGAAPEIHLQYGDPASLEPAYKFDVLRALVRRFEGRKRVWVRPSPEALQRLADPSMAKALSGLIIDKSIAVDLREDLIQVARFGRLTGCIDALLIVIADKGEPIELKCYATAAIRDMGTPDSRRRLRELLNELELLPNRLGALACEALYPGTISSADAASILGKIDTHSDRDVHFQWQIAKHFQESLSVEDSGELLAELNKLASKRPFVALNDTEIPVSQRYLWVLELIQVTLTKLLTKNALSDLDCDAAINAISLLAAAEFLPRFHNDLSKINSATIAHPDVRRGFFWNAVQKWRAEHQDQPSLYSLFRLTLLKPVREDISWMLEDAQSRPDLRDRELVFRFAIQLGTAHGWTAEQQRRMKEATSTDEALRIVFRRINLERKRSWLTRLRYKAFDRQLWRYRWRHLCGYRQRWSAWIRDRWLLNRRWRLLQSASRVDWLASLCIEAGKDEHNFSTVNWGILRRKYGPLVSWATRSGCKRVWSERVPSLPHERGVTASIDNGVIAGLAGIQALREDGEIHFSKLNSEQVQRTTRYAINEMNGFPGWFRELASQQPTIVRTILEQCVEGEWAYAPDRERTYDVLADLASDRAGLAALVRQSVVDKFQTGDAPNKTIRAFAIEILLKGDNPPIDALANIAHGRCGSLSVDDEAFCFWIAVLLQCKALEAISLLTERMAKSAAADQVMMSICCMLEGERRERFPLIAKPSFQTPEALGKLIPLVYRHIRMDDDIDRSRQGAFTPTDRDAAQDFRGRLLTRLAESDDPKATLVLRDLISDPILLKEKDWIEHLLDQRAQTDADFAPWKPEDIRVFTEQHEIDPKTDWDLFEIVCKRLEELKYDVELSTSSLRGELHAGSSEADFRRWVSNKFMERSRQRYTVPQEAEVDLGEKPDIRIENPSTPSVPIEVKLAKSWSGPQLFERLENQLVGQYLRAHKSRFGVYLLGLTNDHRWNNPVDGSKGMNFSQLLEALKKHAESLAAGRADVEAIAVFGIDFRDPRGV